MLALLLMLPVLGASGIRIDISPATESSGPSLDFYGESRWPLTEIDQRAFRITYDEVRRDATITGLIFDKEPESVTVLRAKNDPDSITVKMKATGAKIVDHREESIVVATNNFHNDLTRTSELSGNFKEHVSEIITRYWAKSQELGGQNTIELIFDNWRMSQFSVWGQEIHQIFRQTISSDSGVFMRLLPEKNVTAELRSTIASLRIKIDYEATAEGLICMRYKRLFIIPEVICKDVKQFLQDANKPFIIKNSEIITIDYYYDLQVKIIGNLPNIITDEDYDD